MSLKFAQESSRNINVVARLDTLLIFLLFFLQDLLYGVKFVFYTFFGFVRCFYVFKFLCTSLPSHDDLSLLRLYMYVTSLIRR